MKALVRDNDDASDRRGTVGAQSLKQQLFKKTIDYAPTFPGALRRICSVVVAK